MADIAAEAEISQGLAYRYFTSKKEIFNTLVKHSIDSTGEYDKVIRKLPGSPTEQLGFIITRLLEMRPERSGYYQFLYKVMRDGSISKELSNNDKARKTLHKEMLKLNVKGQFRAEIAKDDAAQLLEAVMSCIKGVWRRMSYTYDGKLSRNFPETKIILRMLRPVRRVNKQ